MVVVSFFVIFAPKFKKEMGRFKLERSIQQEDWWVLTDTENMIVCRFREHQFNETQLFTVLEQLSQQQILQMPTTMREMGDWMAGHHYNIAMPPAPLCIQQTEDDEEQYLESGEFPRFRVMIDDNCNVRELAAALHKAADRMINFSKTNSNAH